MKLRQTVESYWSVWAYQPVLEYWEPYDERMRTKSDALKTMRKLQARYPDERFAVVRTRHDRVTR